MGGHVGGCCLESENLPQLLANVHGHMPRAEYILFRCKICILGSKHLHNSRKGKKLRPDSINERVEERERSMYCPDFFQTRFLWVVANSVFSDGSNNNNNNNGGGKVHYMWIFSKHPFRYIRIRMAEENWKTDGKINTGRQRIRRNFSAKSHRAPPAMISKLFRMRTMAADYASTCIMVLMNYA